MSKTSKDRPSQKRATRASQPVNDGDLYDDDYYDEDEDQGYRPQRQSRSRAQVAQTQQTQRSNQRAGQNYRPRSVPQQPGMNRGYTTFFVTLGVLIMVGAVVVAYLLGVRSRSSNNTNQQVAVAPTAIVDTSLVEEEPDETFPDMPRITIPEFLPLYKDMANRPFLLDVSDKTDYDDGHIKGAVSIPIDELESRVSELPKDKLIVIYCPCSHEQESAKAAYILSQNHGFSLNNLKALVGGWNAWMGQYQQDAVNYPIEPQ